MAGKWVGFPATFGAPKKPEHHEALCWIFEDCRVSIFAPQLGTAQTVSPTISGIFGGSANGSVSASAMPGSTNGNNFGLIKSGVGNFTLSGPNTYAGNTTVNAGTLTLTYAASPSNANPSNNASTITIAPSGATLNLTYTGTGRLAFTERAIS